MALTGDTTLPRWIQRVREDGTTYMEPRDDAARRVTSTAIHGDLEPFVSPIDGSVISDRKGLREHNKRHNVVSADEFTPEFYASKAKERADMYKGRRDARQVQRDRMEIHEIISTLEKRNG